MVTEFYIAISKQSNSKNPKIANIFIPSTAQFSRNIAKLAFPGSSELV